MAVLDGHLALAQIISRGQRLAQSAQLSIFPFDPDAAGVLPQVHFPEQQQLDIWGPEPSSSPSTQSPVLSGFSSWSGKDFEGAPTHSPAASSVSGSVTSTPVRMGPLQHAVPWSPCSSPILCWAALTQKSAGGPPPAQQQALPSQMPCSSTPSARRCLCAALASSPAPPAADAAAPPEAAAGCSTPRGSMIPAVLPPPPAPRAPRPTARLLPLEPPAAAAATAEATSGPGSSSASLCAHLSTGGHSRLQQWLSQMELKLAVPAGHTAPVPADACPPAPKASLAGMHPEVAPTAARPASSSTGPGSVSKAYSNSSASSRKRPLPALWDTLSLLPVGGSLDLCMAAGFADESDSSNRGQAMAAAGAFASGSPATVHSSKRRSLGGGTDASSSSSTTTVAAAVAVPDSSTGAAAEEGAESAVDGGGSAGGVPAPAFVIMGVLSPCTHLA